PLSAVRPEFKLEQPADVRRGERSGICAATNRVRSAARLLGYQLPTTRIGGREIRPPFLWMALPGCGVFSRGFRSSLGWRKEVLSSIFRKIRTAGTYGGRLFLEASDTHVFTEIRLCHAFASAGPS